MLTDSYTLAIEDDTTFFTNSFRYKKRVDAINIPAQFKYHECPRCDGTVYSPPQVESFYCVVCGWAGYTIRM